MRDTRQKGFTMVELMIAVVVVAVLSAVAFPSYQAQLRKGRRADAKTLMLDVMGRQERYFTANNTYANTFAKLGMGATVQTGNAAYQITMAADAAGWAFGYAMTATLASGFTDPQCGNLGLASTGAKTTSVAPGTGCW